MNSLVDKSSMLQDDSLMFKKAAYDAKREKEREKMKQTAATILAIIGVVYVLLIGYLGIYVASALFIAFFMAWLGRYPFYKVIPVAVLVPLMLFMMFEVWFLVPLPKGPLEAALGY